MIPSESVFALCLLEGNVRIDDPGSLIDTTEIACCAHVVLLDSTSEVIQSVCLDVNFDYSFTFLPNGVYTVRVMCAKRNNHFLYDCYDYSWSGDLEDITISGEPYIREDVIVDTRDDTVSSGCCHRCPCQK